MSEKTVRVRRRREDAERNIGVIIDACLDLMGRGADPSMGEVAAAAGVARQTVYAHFPTREALLSAAMTHVVGQVVDGLAAVEPDRGPVDEALDRWAAAAWEILDRFPALLNPAFTATSTADVEDHAPVVQDLRHLLERGSRAGALAPGTTTDWLAAAVLALGHAAGAEVRAGRMSSDAAGAAFRGSARAVCFGAHAGQS